MKQSEPLKTGFVVTEVDEQPWDQPVKLRFPNGSLTRTGNNTLDVYFSAASNGTIYLDQASDTYFKWIPPDTVGLYINSFLIESWTHALVITTSNFLLEDGSYFLLEDGNKLLLEN